MHIKLALKNFCVLTFQLGLFTKKSIELFMRKLVKELNDDVAYRMEVTNHKGEVFTLEKLRKIQVLEYVESFVKCNMVEIKIIKEVIENGLE